MLNLTKYLSFNSLDRTEKAKLNIVLSIFIKGFTILISLFLVPLTLGYLNVYEYGVWLTLSSILMWINYFDIGLGNGLRNKLTETLAVGNKQLGQIYVSTTFFILTIIVGFIYLLFFVSNFWLDWNVILNVSNGTVSNLNNLVSIVFALFCISFVLKFIGNVYMADQLPVINDLLLLFGNVLALVVIYILTLFTNGDLSKVAITFSITPVIVYLLAYYLTFYRKYTYLRPNFKYVKLIYSKALMGLGVQFFIIQIACLLIFTTSNVLISQLFGPEVVTPFNIAFKYYSILTMAFNIVITPMWSAITDAFVKGDNKWIKKSMKQIFIIWAALVIFTMFMVVISNQIFILWVGQDVKIHISLSIFMGFYVTISNFDNIFAYFINGVGKIRLQLYIAVITGLLFIPLSIILGKMFGVNGVILSMTLVLVPSAILLPMQYFKIINGTAKSIWNK